MSTVETFATRDVVMDRDTLSFRITSDVLPRLYNIAGHLVPQDGRCDSHAVEFFQVRSADAASLHPDENLSSVNPRGIKISEFKSSVRVHYRCFQGMAQSQLLHIMLDKETAFSGFTGLVTRFLTGQRIGKRLTDSYS